MQGVSGGTRDLNVRFLPSLASVLESASLPGSSLSEATRSLPFFFFFSFFSLVTPRLLLFSMAEADDPSRPRLALAACFSSACAISLLSGELRPL
jgi:hypothetical protein